MNQLTDFSEQKTMSSREIAQITGKEHKNVLRDCYNLNESYEKLSLLKIEQGYYLHPNTGDQKHKEYLLTKIQTFDLMTGYNTELRIKVNRRWEELEQKQLDFSDPNVVFQLAKNWKEETEKRIALEQENKLKDTQLTHQSLQLRQAAPKVEYFDNVLESKTDIPTTIIAKDLGMSANALNNRLKKLGVQYKRGGYTNGDGVLKNYTWVPYAKYQKDGLGRTKTHHHTGVNGEVITTHHWYWNEKGRLFIYDLLKKHDKPNGDVQQKLGI